MRAIASLHPTEDVRMIPDIVAQAIISTPSTAVAIDWPTSGGSTGARPDIAIFSSPIGFYLQDGSTGAVIPSSNSSGSSSVLSRNIFIPANTPRAYQVPSASTGYSLTAGTSGVITVEYFKKASAF